MMNKKWMVIPACRGISPKATRIMCSFEIDLRINDSMTPAEEENIFEQVSEVIDTSVIGEFITNLVKDYPVKVEVFDDV